MRMPFPLLSRGRGRGTGFAWLCLLTVLIGTGCRRSRNPCPPGMLARRDEGRCVAWSGVEPGLAPDAGGTEPTPRSPFGRLFDAGQTPPAASSPDANLPDTRDAEMAVDGGDLDDAGGDDGGPDGAGGPSAPDAGPTRQVCDQSALDAWFDFHLSADLIDSILDCVWSSAACDEPDCTLPACVGGVANVVGCESCVAEEVSCVASACVADCGSASGSDRCRACACRSGCVAGFEACSGHPLPVCEDCSGTSCQNLSLAPELIMVVVNSLLL